VVELIKQLAKYGGLIGLLFGVIVIGFGFAIVFLWRQNSKLQDKLQEVHDSRIEESMEMNGHLLDYTNKSNEAIMGITIAVNSLKDAFLITNQGRN
ncbi:hypothetical protein KAR91_76705, partial [Candidatus Pacearchaeota archaeon]|nr:hypothetical protein [Candidatus Pacearchaeota archaeon]